MTVFPLQASFVRGELSPKLRGRVDVEQYGQGLADGTNWLVTPQGGVDRRPGTQFVAPINDESQPARLVEFEFNEEQAYCLCLGYGETRFFTLGASVAHAAQDITAITAASPGVFTYSGADNFTIDDYVLITEVVGTTEVNNRILKVLSVNAGSNTLTFYQEDGVTSLSTATYGAYVSGGKLQRIVYINTGFFTLDELYGFQFAQVGDTLYQTRGNVDLPTAKFVRNSDTNWSTPILNFENGPWLPEETSGTTLTPAATGGVVGVAMTSNSTSSYAAADDDTSANAYKVFDRDLSTTLDLAGVTGWVEIDFPSTDTKICDAYWLVASPIAPESMPTHWTIEGYDGSSWVVVDGRAGETAWAGGERRYYEFENSTSFLKYRMRWYAVDGGTTTSLAQIVLHQKASNQTAFNLTASATTGINGGTGFVSSDSGRTVRLMGADGKWRWAQVISRSSSTVVTIRLHDHALLDVTPITRWQLSVLDSGSTEGEPKALAFYQDRLCLAGPTNYPRTVFASESSNYESHRLSDPPVESDAIAAEMTGNQISAVTWLDEMGELIVGTAGAIRVMGPAAQAEPFSSFNIQSRKVSSIGTAAIQPLVTDSGLLYADRYRRRLIALRPADGGGYATDDVSWWSDHLLYGQVVDMAFQEDRFNVAWLVMDDGSLVACTYLPEMGVVGFTPVVIGGTDVEVESVAAIPSPGGAAVYLIVKRTINGVTRRYVEVIAPRFETGDTVEDAVFLDSSATVTGTGITTVTGLTWLLGETVGVYADGVDIGDAVVSSAGTITLPGSVSANKVTVGLRYTSRLETLRAPTAGNKDGSSFGRQMVLNSVALDLLNAKGLRVGSLSDLRAWPHPDLDAPDGQLNSGVFPNLPVDDSHRNNGVVVVETNRAYPATIRALIAGLESAP